MNVATLVFIIISLLLVIILLFRKPSKQSRTLRSIKDSRNGINTARESNKELGNNIRESEEVTGNIKSNNRRARQGIREAIKELEKRQQEQSDK